MTRTISQQSDDVQPELVIQVRNERSDDTCETGADDPSTSERERLGAYEIESELARGGMGVVYRARDTELHRDVAIKVLRKRCAADSVTAARFVAEAQITGQLEHPAIPPVHQVGALADGRPFLAMKLIQGRTLKDLLKERESPAVDRARFLAIFEQICQAVAYAHSRDVIHRDLKPSNVMVGAFGEVQVMDWGLAKKLGDAQPTDLPTTESAPASIPDRTTDDRGEDSSSSRTRAGDVMGTAAYMPPEQARGDVGAIDCRADVFSLGGILCTLLTGKPPYAGQSGTDVLAKASTGELGDAMSRLDSCGADPELVALCRRCLAVDRDERPRDAGEVGEAVEAHLAAIEDRARQAELDRVRMAEQRKRRRMQLSLIASVVGLVVVAGAGIALASFWQQAEEAREQAETSGRQAEDARQESETARQRAEKARSQAERARQLEATARRQAEDARKRADAEKQRADAARAAAESARDQLSIEKKATEAAKAALEQAEYVHSIYLADRALRENQLARAQELLKNVKPALRGWEWRYLNAQCHPELFTAAGVVPVFSPGGDLLAVNSRGTIHILDGFTGEQKRVLRARAPLLSFSFSPEGRLFAATGADGAVHLFNVGTGKETHVLKGRAPLGGPAFSPDGTRVAVGFGVKVQNRRLMTTGDGVVRVFDTGTGKEVLALTGPRSATTKGPKVLGLDHPQFSADGGHIVARGLGGSLRVFDAGTGKERASIEKTTGIPRLSSDGTTVLANGIDGKVRTYDVQTGTVKSTLQGALVTPFSPTPVLSPGGARAALLDNARRVLVYDTRTGEKLLTLQQPKGLGVPAFSPDGRLIAVAPTSHGGDGVIRVYDAKTGNEKLVIRAPANLRAPTFSPDGSRLAAPPASRGGDGLVRVYDVRLGQRTTYLRGLRGNRGLQEYTQQIHYGHKALMLRGPSPRYRPVLARDGNTVAFLCRDKAVRVFDAQTGQMKFALRGARELSVPVFNPAGDRLAVVATEQDGHRVLRLHETRTGKEQWTFAESVGSGNPSFSPDGRQLAIVGKDGVIRILAVANGQPIRSLRAGKGFSQSPIFSRDGSRIYGLIPGAALQAFNAQTGQEEVVIRRRKLQEQPGRKPGIRGLFSMIRGFEPGRVSVARLSPDGTRLVFTGSRFKNDRRVFVHDTQTGKELYVLKGRAGFESVVISPDSSTVACVGLDGRVYVYALKTGKKLSEIAGASKIRTAQYGPSGKTLIVGYDPLFGEAGTARVHDVRTGREMLTLTDLPFRYRPVFSADAQRIALVCGQGMNDLVALVEAPRDLEQHRKNQQRRVKLNAGAWHRDQLQECQHAQDWQGVAFHARQLARLEPENGQFHYDLARGLARLGQRKKAGESFRKALALKGLSSTARIGIHAELGHWKEALQLIDEATRDPNAPPSLRYQQAVLQLQLDDRAGYVKTCAIRWEQFSKLRLMGDVNSLVWTSALAPGAIKDYDRAVKVSRALVRRTPGGHAYQNTLGAILYRAGKYQDAVTELEKSMKLGPTGGHPVDFLFMAMAQQKLGRTAEAKDWLEKARQKVKSDPPTVWMYRLELKVLQQEAAAQLSKKHPQ